MGQGPKRLPELPWPPASFSSRQKSFTVFLLVGRAGPSGAEGGNGAAKGGGGGKGPLMGGGGGGGGGGGPPGSRGGGGGTPFPASTDSTFNMSWSSSSPRSEKSRSPMQSLGTRVGSAWMGSSLGLGGVGGSLGSDSRLRWTRSRTRGVGLWGVLGIGAASGESHGSRVSRKTEAAVSFMPSVGQQQRGWTLSAHLLTWVSVSLVRHGPSQCLCPALGQCSLLLCFCCRHILQEPGSEGKDVSAMASDTAIAQDTAHALLSLWVPSPIAGTHRHTGNSPCTKQSEDLLP